MSETIIGDDDLPKKPEKSIVPIHSQGELIPLEITNYNDALTLSAQLLASKWFQKNYKRPEEIAAILLKGHELGFKPMTALDHLNIINGKPVLSSWAMASLINNTKHVAYQLVEDYVPIELVRKDSQGNETTYTDRRTTFRWFKQIFGSKTIEQDISYTWTEAYQMGLTSNDNWKKQPKNMLRIRALTTGARLVAPEALMGTYEVSEFTDNYEIVEGHTVIKS